MVIHIILDLLLSSTVKIKTGYLESGSSIAARLSRMNS